MSARDVILASMERTTGKKAMPPWVVYAQRTIEDLEAAGYRIVGPGDAETVDRDREGDMARRLASELVSMSGLGSVWRLDRDAATTLAEIIAQFVRAEIAAAIRAMVKS